MGLIERILAGNTFTRKTVPLTLDAGNSRKSGSVDTLGGSFIILSATSQRPCRIRLYSDQSSMLIDNSRPSTNFNISESVGLISDVVLESTDNSFSFDPPIIGTTFSGGDTWYNISGSLSGDNITLTVFPFAIEGDSTTDRRTLVMSGSAIPAGGQVSGSITSPKSFLILSGSATSESRLRLYSTPITEVPSYEVSRAFTTAPTSGSHLIADMMFDSASFQYKLVPVLEAYTWQNDVYKIGTGILGYILKNEKATPETITASIYIHSTED